ncbi:hypothetical protein X474_13580 [Dethiosulfatarculus sandiegensis]|uniref:Uncharacterized protein n=1 Tax=Dethiosulfatarculus sandiegensis TaxID=1429043 RepID=A0A0D2JCP3_9BACT|nr:hypothetical protein X474_13580 [Dethiosulfatarculus sandiegensis]
MLIKAREKSRPAGRFFKVLTEIPGDFEGEGSRALAAYPPKRFSC